MPTDKPRFTITVDDELFKQITEYRFVNRMKSQTQAVLSLIEKGLLALSDGQVTDFSSSAEEDHVKKYRDLDDHGKKLVDTVLSIEYERCSENPPSKEKAPRKHEVYYAAANGGHAEPNDVDPDELDKLLSEHPTTYDV